jgi:hypothetical protein
VNFKYDRFGSNDSAPPTSGARLWEKKQNPQVEKRYLGAPLRRTAAMILLTTLLVSAAFAFKNVRVANPIRIEVDHSDFQVESSFVPRLIGIQLSISGFRSLEQPRHRSTDPDEDLGLVKPKEPYRTTLRIEEEGQDFSKPTVLSAIEFRVVAKKAIEIGFSMEPVEAVDIWAACDEKSSMCHAGLGPSAKELSFCSGSNGAWPLEITYTDPSSTKHSRTFSRVGCFRVLTDEPLYVSADNGFATSSPFEVHLKSETPFITSSTPEPILVDKKPLDLQKARVDDLKIRAGKDSDEERSYLSWSLKPIPGLPRKYRFTATSPNISFLAANNEQMLKAELDPDAQIQIPAIQIQDIHDQVQAGSFSIYDRFRASDLSDVIVSSKDLNGIPQVKFRTGFLVPAVTDLLDQNQSLNQQDVLLRLCEGMLSYVKDKNPSDKEAQQIEAGQLAGLLFAKRSIRNRTRHGSAQVFLKIQTIEFEPYLERAAKDEKHSEVSKLLTEMLSLLRRQGSTTYEIPSVAADEKYPVLVGLAFPDRTETRSYHGKITIKGKNFAELEVPFDFEVYDPWPRRWTAIWEFIRIPLTAIAGALAGLWFASRKETKEGTSGESSRQEIKAAPAITPAPAVNLGSTPETGRTESKGIPSTDKH